MPLTVGTKAPDFTLPTKTGEGPKQIKLSDNFGKKNTLLLFFPMAFTGTCTTEMCGVSNDSTAFRLLYAAKSLLTPHISVVQVPVKAIGKNTRSVLLFPKFSLRLDRNSDV